MNSGRQRRSKQRRETGTRERLVRAAQGCLRTGGIAAASSRAIADRADANLAAITYHFGSKDQLVAEALSQELSDWTQPVLDLLTQPDDPATRLLNAVNALTHTFETQRERVPGLLEVFVHAARAPEPNNPLTRIWRDLHTRLTAVITELRTSTAVPTWVEPNAMAALILAVAAGTAVSLTVEPDGATHRDIATQFTGLLLAAANPHRPARRTR
jgi:AcrR family transcriptional regulator